MKTITRIVALILMTISSFTVVSQTNKISQEIIRSDFGYILYDENKIPYKVDTTSITVKFIIPSLDLIDKQPRIVMLEQRFQIKIQNDNSSNS